MVPGSEITVGARLLASIRKSLRRPEPVDVLKYRAELRREISRNLDWSENRTPEIILIRLSKKDKYPELGEGLFGRMHWGKYEVKRPHDKGLELYSIGYHVTIKNHKARIARVDEKRNTALVVPVSRIPYERIAHIDWEPDEFYSLPRFYAVYGRRGFQKGAVVYGRARWQASSMPNPYNDNDLEELHGVKFQGYGGTPTRWISHRLWRLKERWKNRKNKPLSTNYDTD